MTSPIPKTTELPSSTLTSRRTEQDVGYKDLTMQPYIPSREEEYNKNHGQTVRPRRRNNRLYWRPSLSDVNPNEPRPSGPPQKQYNKFYTISASNGCHLSSIDVIAANRVIGNTLKGKPTKINETRCGTLLVEVTNYQQSRTITTLAGVPVTVAAHERLNESRGTI
jgi:hypothetical protein